MNYELSLPSDNPKEIYRRIRNYLAGRVVGATRDQALLQEVIKCLFCRVYIAHHSASDSTPSADPIEVSKIYRSAFRDIKKTLPNVFDQHDEIELDMSSISFIDEQLSLIDITNPLWDPLGDAYEAFASSSLRQQEGQFFTPLNAVEWLVKAVAPTASDFVIDPACGAGGFLSAVARFNLRNGSDASDATKRLYGIEKDRLLARLARSHIAITTLTEAPIICGDALSFIGDDETPLNADDYIESFDIVLSNPPFGSKIISASDAVRGKFELGYKWRRQKKIGAYAKTTELQKNVPPQILFVERIISLLKPGGRLGVVLPESLVSSASYGHVVQYMTEHLRLAAVVGMPESLFKSSGKGGTHTKTCLIIAEKPKRKSRTYSIYMAETKWCGNDSRGKSINKDDLPIVLSEYHQFKSKNAVPKFGYLTQSDALVGTILCPRYYEPAAERELKPLRKSHDLVLIRDLVDDGVLSFSTGDEPGKMAYGTGNIPFIRTSDISNWEIKFDPKHCLSEEWYEKYRVKQDVRESDILFVRDGTYLIGSCGFISKYDTRIVYQSHIYKIRCNKPEIISPYLLLAALSCDPVQTQIRAKRFTQDIIDSIGARVFELVLPIPRNSENRHFVESTVEKSIFDRIEARELARLARLRVCAIS